mmetsp:Transcript_52461/g.170372  ORF Transcript_52461/g.170372 Transcript_52461/m.170372 type:complete len:1004 (-) Transcript_52461:81-3092(-)
MAACFGGSLVALLCLAFAFASAHDAAILDAAALVAADVAEIGGGCAAAEQVQSHVLLQRSVRHQKTVKGVTDGLAGPLSNVTIGGTGGRRPWETEATGGELACGVSTFAPGYHRCEGACPLLAPVYTLGCHWRCVPKDQCGGTSDVADAEKQICRRCNVPACKHCKSKEDSCEVCTVGYTLVDGKCKGGVKRAWIAVFVIVGVLLFALLIWYIGLVCRPIVNAEGLEAALRMRGQAALHDIHGVADVWYSLGSNLAAMPEDGAAPIGGPGLLLLFRFQMAVLAWVIFVIVCWLLLSRHLGWELLVVGTYLVEDEQEMCQAIRWGRGVRDRVAVGKLCFTVTLYALSTLGCLIFAVCQYQRVQEIDGNTCTMMDYAMFLYGLPPQTGSGVEAEVEGYVREVSARELVGVSLCWDFRERADDVLALLERDVWRREHDTHDEAPPLLSEHHTSRNAELLQRLLCMCQPLLHMIDHVFFSAFASSRAAPPLGEGAPVDYHEADKKAALALLSELQTSNTCIAVFASEEDRDRALQALASPESTLYRGQHRLSGVVKQREPATVLWENVSIPNRRIVFNMIKGVAAMLLSIVLWTLIFYAPFAWYEASTYRSLGTPPPLWAETAFSMLVVVGNQLMYFICSWIAESVGFRSQDHIQACYLFLYTFAVLVNTVVDIAIVLYTTYISMVVRGIRTNDGVLIEDLPDIASVFRSYPMMKVFGSTLFDYNFPACFVLPFVMEGLFTVILPYHLGTRIVRSRHLTLTQSEACLAPIIFDLTRYGDILVNLTLTAFAFFTASGWVLKTLVGLLTGNLFIYILDHCRVLRVVRNFYLNSAQTDSVAQQLLSIPCGILAACTAFQLQGLGFGAKWNTWGVLFTVFSIHAVLHFVFVRSLVPILGSVKHDHSQDRYEKTAARFPANYFNANPVHCLRSVFLHDDQSPPCIFHVPGKEHVLECNEKLGLHFKCGVPCVKDATPSSSGGCGSPRQQRVWSDRTDHRQTPQIVRMLSKLF